MTTLPAFGHLRKDRGFRVSEPIGRASFVEKGRHLILGRRENRSSLDSLIFLGKVIEHTQVKDKYDANIWLDVSFPHVVFLCGTRGSGKSFDIGVLAEGLVLTERTKACTVKKPLSVVVFDLQNQFWTLGLPPDGSLAEDKDHLGLLNDWGLEPNSVRGVELYIPPGDKKIVGSEIELILSASDLSADDLCSFWNTDIYSPQGHLVSTLIDKVAHTGYETMKSGGNRDRGRERILPKTTYEISDLISCLQEDTDVLTKTNPQVSEALLWRLQSLEKSRLFTAKGLDFRHLLQPGQISALLLRNLDDATKGLVAGIVLRKQYSIMGEFHTRRKVFHRLKKQLKEENLPERVWTIIDEAHVVCPTSFETSATRSAIEYVKRGRDAGLSLVLATQQPSAIDTRVLSQVDLTIVHRLTIDGDISAALARIPAYLPARISAGSATKDPRVVVRLLEPGEAIIGDSQCDRAFLGIIRPRLTAHGGAEPK